MIRIEGAVDPAEVAVVLALLTREAAAPEPSPYDRWRVQRLRALRRDGSRRPR